MVTVADAVTITITAGLPIGTETRIMRTVASANAITVARSGSETIEGGTTFETHGAQVASTGNYAEVVLKKISATAWMFVRGEVSGSNSNGSWIKYGDGTMVQWGFKNSSNLTNNAVNANLGLYGWSYVYGVDTITFPAPFYSVLSFTPVSAEGHGLSTRSQLITTSSCDYIVFGSTPTEYAKCRWQAIGRWKA